MDIFTIQVGWIGGYKPKVSPIPPVPPTPIVQVEEPRRWPGPPVLLYTDEPRMRQRREDEEIMFL